MMTFIYLLALPAIAALIGFALGYAAIHFKVEGEPLVEEINELLPNGQCGQCGFPGCKEAARAIAHGEAKPSACPPGGAVTAKKIAELLGVADDADASGKPSIAAIDVTLCDGCGRCLKQCSFDAIVGASRQMHGVIADACTGCGSCTDVCPHEGIHLYPDPAMEIHATKPSLSLPPHAMTVGVLNHA